MIKTLTIAGEIDELAKLGKEAYGPLVELLGHRNINMRLNAAHALARRGEGVIPLIELAVKENGFWLGELRKKMDEDSKEYREEFWRRTMFDSWRERGGVYSHLAGTQKADSKPAKILHFAAEGIMDMEEKAVPDLIQALRHENKEVRHFAARILRHAKDTRSVEPLIEALDDEDAEVRTAAAETLGEIGSKKEINQAVKPLLGMFEKVVNDEKMMVHSPTLEMMAPSHTLERRVQHMTMGYWTKEGEEYSLYGRGSRDYAEAAQEALLKMGEYSLPEIVRSACSEHEMVACYSIDLLGDATVEKSLDVRKILVPLLESSSPNIRGVAASSLSNFKPKEEDLQHVGILMEMLDGEFSEFHGALAALTNIGSEFEIQGLVPRMLTFTVPAEESAKKQDFLMEERTSYEVRSKVLTCLGRLGSWAEPQIVDALAHESQTVRLSAAEALLRTRGLKQGDKAAQHLTKMLEGLDREVIQVKLNELEMAASKMYENPDDPTLKHEMEKCKKALDKSIRVQFTILQALGKTGSEKAIEPLGRFLKKAYGSSHINDSNTRVIAGQALAEIGNGDCATLLVEAIERFEEAARKADKERMKNAMEGYASIDPYFLYDRNPWHSPPKTEGGYHREALEKMGREAVPKLLEILKEPQEEMSQASNIESESSWTSMLRFFVNKEKYMRKDTAFRALVEIGKREGMPELIPALVSFVKNEPAGIWLVELIKGFGVDAAPHLIDLLSGDDKGLRRGIISALIDIGKDNPLPEAVPKLKAIMVEKDEKMEGTPLHIPQAAFTAITIIGTRVEIPDVIDDMVDNLASTLRERETFDKELALKLAEMKNCVPKLLNALQSEKSEIRQAAAGTLGLAKTDEELPEAVAALIGLFEDSEDKVKCAAMISLGWLGDKIEMPEAVAPLAKLMEHEEPDIMSNAAQTLLNISVKTDISEVIAPLLDTLMKWMKMRGKERLTDKKGKLVWWEKDSLQTPYMPNIHGKLGRYAVPHLIGMLNDERAQLAVEMLHEISKEHAIPEAAGPLIAALSSNKTIDKMDVLHALYNIGSKAEIPEAAEPIIGLLEDEELKGVAVETLGNIGAVADIPEAGLPLVKVMASGEQIRSTAAHAIERIAEPRSLSYKRIAVDHNVGHARELGLEETKKIMLEYVQMAKEAGGDIEETEKSLAQFFVQVVAAESKARTKMDGELLKGFHKPPAKEPAAKKPKLKR